MISKTTFLEEYNHIRSKFIKPFDLIKKKKKKTLILQNIISEGAATYSEIIKILNKEKHPF